MGASRATRDHLEETAGTKGPRDTRVLSKAHRAEHYAGGHEVLVLQLAREEEAPHHVHHRQQRCGESTRARAHLHTHTCGGAPEWAHTRTRERAHEHAHAKARPHTRTDTHTRTHMHTQTRTHTRARARAHTRAHTHTTRAHSIGNAISPDASPAACASPSNCGSLQYKAACILPVHTPATRQHTSYPEYNSVH